MVKPKINVGALTDEIRVTSRKADFVGTPTGQRKERSGVSGKLTYANEQHLSAVTLQKLSRHSMAKGSENTEDLQRFGNRKEVQWL